MAPLPRVLPGGRGADRAAEPRGRRRDDRDDRGGAARARARALPDRRGPGRLLPRHPGGPGHADPAAAARAARRPRPQGPLGPRAPGRRARAARGGERAAAGPAHALRPRRRARARRARSSRTRARRPALANLAEVYRLLRAYGLADSVLLDLGEVRGFDYYSGVHFEAYVAGLGAPLAGGGRYDQMLARFGYDCPATGFAFEVGRALLAMESQGTEPCGWPGRTSSSSTSRATRRARSRSRGGCATAAAAVARDIISRAARGVARLRAAASARAGRWSSAAAARPDRVAVVDLRPGADGAGERTVPARRTLLADPRPHFPGIGGGGHA